MLPELETLNHIRLEEDKSYGELAEEIGLGTPSTLYKLLAEKCQPTDRSLYKIRKFLDARQRPSRRKKVTA